MSRGITSITAACLAVVAVASTAGPVGAATLATPPVAAEGVFPSVVTVPLQVTTLNDAGPGSLREAILAANLLPIGSAAAIDFTVAGTITLASDLPDIGHRAIIDGTSAPGYLPDAPVVVVDFAGNAGLQFAPGSDDSSLLGLGVGGASGNGVTIAANRITLHGNYIGVDPTSASPAFANGGDGVHLASHTHHNVIGVNSAGASGAVSNVISGNRGAGVKMVNSTYNTVVANRIGTTPAGSAAIPNSGAGIELTLKSDHNQIGGTVFVDSTTGIANNPTGSKGTVPEVYVVPPLGNLVSGNAGHGILINGRSRYNMLNGNFVGTTADGDAAIGNGLDGVNITDADRNTLQGCKFTNNPFVYYNVVSGNGGNGLRISNSDNIVVQANFFGVGANNTTVVANRLDGILVDGTSTNVQVGGVIPLGNVVSGNTRNGIEVRDKVNGFITFNTFGGLLAFKGAAPNGRSGLLVTSTGGNNLARTNVFSGNIGHGIEISGRATGVTVDPNIVGLTTNGRTKLPNGGSGLVLAGQAHHNTVGGTRRSVIPQNLFSGNRGFGIAMVGSAHHNQVLDTFIGTAVFGLSGASNGRGGLLIAGSAHDNTIGSPTSQGRVGTRGELRSPSNVISGNSGFGVGLGAGSRGNLVVNNYVGLDRLGRRLPNSGPAIVDAGVGNALVGNSVSPR
jgi:hypothetical protein